MTESAASDAGGAEVIEDDLEVVVFDVVVVVDVVDDEAVVAEASGLEASPVLVGRCRSCRTR